MEPSFMILLTPWKGKPDALPYIESTFSERIDVKDPYKNPVYSNSWFEYSSMRAGKPVPLTEDYKLPKSFYWICSDVKSLNTDYYSHSKGVILSAAFFNLLKSFHSEDEYETADVIPVSKKGELISEKKYIFIRFLNQVIKTYIDFDNSPRKKRANKVLPMYLYSIFKLKADKVPDFFWLKNELITKQELGEKINTEQFNGFKMVTLETYMEEIDFRDNNPYPDLKMMQTHDAMIFGDEH